MAGLRDTQRYQYATRGVRGPDPNGPAYNGRRGWMGRAGWWRFGIEVIVQRGNKGGVYIEPTTIETLDTIITIKVRYKGKIWDKVYYITPSEPLKVVAKMITKLIKEARAKLKGINIEEEEIKFTVRKIDK